MAAILLLAHAAPAGAISVPPQFVVESLTPGTNFDTPTTMAYLPGGRLLVAEKGGRVWSVHLGVRHSTPLIDLSNEVLDSGDRGLIGLAVDPNYLANRRIYLLYTVDPDSNGVDTNDDAFGRLARYEVSAADSQAVDPASRTILMGATWGTGPCSGSLSHTIGGLEWGRDGTLLVTAGEGAQFDFGADDGGQDPNMFGEDRTDPLEDIGAFRAQDIGALGGKMLRIDPETGHGLPSNPFWDGDPGSVRSRIWAYGLRNPFRFARRPGTGSTDPAAGNPGAIFIGDVGWSRHEELNVADVPGRNFGWPCYEGPIERQEYQEATPAHHGCPSLGTPDNPSTPSPPLAAWHHEFEEQSMPPTLLGNCVVAGVFYTGTRFPGAYRHFFIGDFGQSWIKVAVIDAQNGLIEIRDFAEDADGPVCFRAEPGSGDIVYCAINDGEIRRIRYTGMAGNTAPVAIAQAAPDAGIVPLQVSFSSAASFDPDGDPVTRSWIFGDGQGSGAANPTHAYQLPGARQAILTLDDGRGGIGRDTVLVIASGEGFPSSPVLDAFDRADGPLAGPSWVDPVHALAGLAVEDSALVQDCCEYGSPVWSGGPFGPDQEVYVTFDATTPGATEHDLVLKLQGTTSNAAHIEVRYDDSRSLTEVSTFAPTQGWVLRGSFPYVFRAGERFGARAYANGTVDVYKNGAVIGTVSTGNWPFAGAGGRIGLTIDGAYQSRLDDFGGGDAVLSSNTPPLASITEPVDGAFFTAADSVQLRGAGWDAQQAATTLDYDWSVNIHHNTHVHPGSYLVSGTAAAILPGSHDDGTGVFYEVTLRVSDAGGLADTASVNVFPEVDLAPSPVTVFPAVPNTAAPARYSFTVRNAGRMLAPFSRWRLMAGTTTLAEGDTLVPPLDSVLVERDVPAMLPAGDHDLRVVVDTLGGVHETVEDNNAATRTLTVEQAQVGVPNGPPRLMLSPPRPNPTRGGMAMTLDLPVASAVRVVVHDPLGREVWRGPETARDAGRWTIEWPGVTRSGALAPSGLYLVRVTAGGRSWDRRVAVIR